MQNAKSSLSQMQCQRLYGIPRENSVTAKIPQTFQGWNIINQNLIQTIAWSCTNTAEHSIHDSVRSQVQIQERSILPEENTKLRHHYESLGS